MVRVRQSRGRLGEFCSRSRTMWSRARARVRAEIRAAVSLGLGVKFC